MGTPIEDNGLLRVEGAQLVNSAGLPVRLRGASSHGINFNPQKSYVNPENMRLMRAWGANVFRVARYVIWGNDLRELIPNHTALQTVEPAIRAIIDAGMYAIVDWHVLKDLDPLLYKHEALQFFLDVHRRFEDVAHALIFEIANEPNPGVDGKARVTWEDNIKPYADWIISELRRARIHNVVLVPTSHWSQHPLEPRNLPLDDDENVMFTTHFYASDEHHRQDIRPELEDAIQAGVPLFISEWGSTGRHGNEAIDECMVDDWIDLLDRHGLSWVYWWFGAHDADHDESSSVLHAGSPFSGPYEDAQVKQSGRILRRLLWSTSDAPA